MQCDSKKKEESQALKVVCTPELRGVGAADKRSSFLVMASIAAPEYRAEERAAVDMVCVIDRSGSMAGQRLEMAKATVEFVVANLRSDDRLGVVTYDDVVTNHFPLRPMTAEGKAAIAAVKSIVGAGSTNLCGGLVEGVDQMRRRDGEKKNEVASVLLFTDGQANVGYMRAEEIIKATINADYARLAFQPNQQQQQQQQPPRPQQLQQQPPHPQQLQQYWAMPVPLPSVAQAQNPADFGGLSPAASGEQLKKPSTPPPAEEKKRSTASEDMPLPCTINTFGFGTDHDATLLKKIADHGQGIVVGQDIRVTFEAIGGGEQVRINRILTRFKTTEVEPGRVYEVALGDIQSEERRDILVDVSIAGATTDVEADTPEWPVLKTTVTYTNVITGRSGARAEHSATIIRRPAADHHHHDEARDVAVDRQLNRWLAAEAMEAANEVARGGDMERARAIIKRASDRIRESVSRADEFCQSLVSDLARCEGGLVSHGSWAAGGSKMLTNQMQAHQVQRSTNVGSASQASYQSSARCQMQQQQQQIFKPQP
ncbi:von Willebrand factor type A domain containing protein [Acanthamoeba castellanii str. Neff]|uniref:von Willebrand factor type A domain containing protein n=1 Tax=Acanthamoeba castellanii (strain ATCC 30010 / Neff) TaxID=1257118 RepID=L8H4B2_ACACF|nr:von Willebrand factor type A domain containing protein [Acanthamoeba castellanii str. Neff]ELR19543.1 von Willebrand factor type A domain containing protein [Acanthamoeba castellanii str. Neff]